MKKILSSLLLATSVLTLAACQTQSSTESSNPEQTSVATPTSTETSSAIAPIGSVANDLAVDKEALMATVAPTFTQADYVDAETGLTITYNVYLPENYDESKTYPTVVFIADSSLAGREATESLTQGRGGVVWASEDWQSVHESIVIVPTYPEVILDDHSGYTTTDYVDATKRLIDHASQEYAVDSNRIYGTGQSMGTMTTLILASQYTDLYAGVMIVDGQWDISTLSGLESQNLIYFAAEDDERAWTGMQEVMALFDTDGVASTYAQWDGTWTPDQLSQAMTELTEAGTAANFVSWATGTIDISDSPFSGSSAYHMASFDYAYNAVAAMEWLFQQSK